MEEIFESSVRSAGDIAGIFEFDGETSYFYLYRLNAEEGSKVIDAIKISSNEPGYRADDVHISWTKNEDYVLLHIQGKIWAVFSSDGVEKFFGEYDKGFQPSIPSHIKIDLQN